MMDTALILSDLYGAGYKSSRLAGALNGIRDKTGAFCATLYWFRRTPDALHIVRQEGCSNTPHALDGMRQHGFENPRTLSAVNPYDEDVQWLEDSALPPQLHDRIERWQAMLAEVQMGTFLGARIACGAQYELGLALHARVGGGGFDNTARSLLHELMPHVRESMGLLEQAERSHHEKDAVSSAINKLNCPLLIGDADGRIMHVNTAGRQLLEELRLLPLDSAQQVPCGHMASGNLLHILLAGVENQGPMELRVQRRKLLVHAMPLNDDGMAQGEQAAPAPRVLLAFSTDDVMPAVQTEQVRRYFSITPREANLLVGLCNGLDPASYASHEGISIHTARSQLKNLMAKMNARRQSDLVRMTLSSPLGIFQLSN